MQKVNLTAAPQDGIGLKRLPLLGGPHFGPVPRASERDVALLQGRDDVPRVTDEVDEPRPGSREGADRH